MAKNKLERCIRKVKKKNKKVNPYAVCKASLNKFNKTQLNKGIKIELEHTKNKTLASKIAKDHLKENPDYYKQVKLKKGYIEKLVSVKKKK